MEDYVLFVPRLHVGLRCAFRLAHDHCGPASGRRLDRLECGYGALYRFSRLYFLYEGAGGHAVQPRIHAGLNRAGHSHTSWHAAVSCADWLDRCRRYRTGPDCDHCAQRSPVKRRTEIKTSSLFCASSLPEVDHPAAPRCCGADDRKSADASTLWVTSALLFCRRVKNWLGYVHPVHPASFPDSHFPQWLPPARWPYHTWIGRWPAR